jgi:hypothetical protein
MGLCHIGQLRLFAAFAYYYIILCIFTFGYPFRWQIGQHDKLALQVFSIAANCSFSLVARFVAGNSGFHFRLLLLLLLCHIPANIWKHYYDGLYSIIGCLRGAALIVQCYYFIYQFGLLKVLTANLLLPVRFALIGYLQHSKQFGGKYNLCRQTLPLRPYECT